MGATGAAALCYAQPSAHDQNNKENRPMTLTLPPSPPGRRGPVFV